jgi:hypothetical protein
MPHAEGEGGAGHAGQDRLADPQPADFQHRDRPEVGPGPRRAGPAVAQVRFEGAADQDARRGRLDAHQTVMRQSGAAPEQEQQGGRQEQGA